MTIIIEKSKTADIGSEYPQVDVETLLASTHQHRRDIYNAMIHFADSLILKAGEHDLHKIETINAFHEAFTNGFKDETWWNEHKKERHHLPDDMTDIDLLDILEYIADCVMSGMARTGTIYDVKISNEKLQLAFKNTVYKLKNDIVVEDK